MYFNLSKLMLANTMMIGVIMTICSNNWVSMWMGLEMSLLSFIPFMQTENQISSESMIKYFIIQSVASTLFLFSVSIMLIGVNMMMENELISMAMLIKMGSAPFHLWVLKIIESMSMNAIFTMLTVLKMPPLMIMYQINSKFITIPVLMGMVLSSVSCLNQTSMRKTLGYSSIYNMSLILSTININNIIWMFMSIYSLMMMFLVKLIKMMKINYINQMIINDYSKWLKITIWINMLSMSGFPMLMGFINKMMIMQMMIMNNQIIMVTTLVLTSMLVTLFYLRMTFNCMMNYFTFKKWTNTENKYLYFMLTINLSLMPLVFSINSIY
uniref:NADH-ubiquinone oxidoreductase chain 2 n=1 Tax=Hishimonoides recurvatis TaxID=1970786 RepID=A0A499P6K5_9HEMI|nr:NADH dehydrogenase subunit 2 [Hishimonoides recurvatis]